MGSKINDLLKQLAKTKKPPKHKFSKGKELKIPSLLGSTKTKTIKPKHVILPLSGARVHWHIAIGLINAPKSKKTLYKSYIPKSGAFSQKYTKEQLKTWRKFGQGIFVGALKPFVEKHGREYLYGYATHVVSHRKTYSLAHISEAQDYLKVHGYLGAPDLTKQYFFIKYGTSKFNRLGDDTYYQTLLRLRKVVTTKTELRKVESMIKARKREFRHTKADYYYTQYLKERLEHKIETNAKYALSERSQQYVLDLEAKLKRMTDPYSSAANKPYFKYIAKEMGLWLSQTAWGTDEEFIKMFYAKHNGLNPADSIGRGREKYAYEELIEWFLETELKVPLHSTNLTWLKNPRLMQTMKRKLAKKFSQEQINEYIKENLTNPENLSRSGKPDPLVDWHSLYGYMRETPRGAYFGQDVEREVTSQLRDIEDKFNREYDEFKRTDKAKRKKFEDDMKKYYPAGDLTSHFQAVYEFKRQAKKHRDKRLKTQMKKK